MAPRAIRIHVSVGLATVMYNPGKGQVLWRKPSPGRGDACRHRLIDVATSAMCLRMGGASSARFCQFCQLPERSSSRQSSRP